MDIYPSEKPRLALVQNGLSVEFDSVAAVPYEVSLGIRAVAMQSHGSNVYEVLRHGIDWIESQDLETYRMQPFAPHANDMVVTRAMMRNADNLNTYLQNTEISPRSVFGTLLSRYVSIRERELLRPVLQNGVYDLSAFRRLRPRRGSR